MMLDPPTVFFSFLNLLSNAIIQLIDVIFDLSKENYWANVDKCYKQQQQQQMTFQ